jgi:hypothetical protein
VTNANQYSIPDVLAQLQGKIAGCIGFLGHRLQQALPQSGACSDGFKALALQPLPDPKHYNHA